MRALFFRDPLLNYISTWSTYNTWMFNRSSWVQNIPGWMSFGEPGRMMLKPVNLMNAPGYSFGVLLCTMADLLGHAQSQVALAEHQQHRLDRRLIGWTFIFDFFIEGLMF